MIYFDTENVPISNVQELLEKLYRVDLKTKNEKYPYRIFMARSTYSDKELTKTQCGTARRGFVDLYNIVTTYIPTATKEELAYYLVNYFNCFYCSNIKKLVFLIDSMKPGFTARMDRAYNQFFVDSDGYSYVKIKALAKKHVP